MWPCSFKSLASGKKSIQLCPSAHYSATSAHFFYITVHYTYGMLILPCAHMHARGSRSTTYSLISLVDLLVIVWLVSCSDPTCQAHTHVCAYTHMHVRRVWVWSYSEVLFKALTLLVNTLYTTICAYAPLP